MCCAPVIAIAGAHEPKAWQAATALRMNREPAELEIQQPSTK